MPELTEYLAHREKMEGEWEAWQQVGRMFQELGLDMNEGGNADRLHAAIVCWGEELVQLRLADPDTEHATAALAEKRELLARKLAER